MFLNTRYADVGVYIFSTKKLQKSCLY